MTIEADPKTQPETSTGGAPSTAPAPTTPPAAPVQADTETRAELARMREQLATQTAQLATLAGAKEDEDPMAAMNRRLEAAESRSRAAETEAVVAHVKAASAATEQEVRLALHGAIASKLLDPGTEIGAYKQKALDVLRANAPSLFLRPAAPPNPASGTAPIVQPTTPPPQGVLPPEPKGSSTINEAVRASEMAFKEKFGFAADNLLLRSSN